MHVWAFIDYDVREPILFATITKAKELTFQGEPEIQWVQQGPDKFTAHASGRFAPVAELVKMEVYS